MLSALQQYQREVVYKTGKEHVTADMLARAPVEVAKDRAPGEQIFTINQLKSFMFDLSRISMRRDLQLLEQTFNLIQQETRKDPSNIEPTSSYDIVRMAFQTGLCSRGNQGASFVQRLISSS